MAARLFTIIGDANVRRNLTGLNIGSREAMKTAQVIDYLGNCPIDQALSEVRLESSACVVAGITDFILASGDCGTINASVDPALLSLFTSLSSFSISRPALQAWPPFQY